ncbi:WD40 repeat-like protein [Trichoderma velutinum]
MTSSTVPEFKTTNNAGYDRHEDGSVLNVTCLFPRSDSGYGSIDDSPHHPRADYVSHLDEAESRHGPGLSAGRAKKATSPRLVRSNQSPCSTPALYCPFLAWSPQQLSLLPDCKDGTKMPLSQQKCVTGGPRTPDRFVPRRDGDESSRQVYQTTKPLQDLSPAEKLLRRKGVFLAQFSAPQRPPARALDDAHMALVGHPPSQGGGALSNIRSETRQPSQGNVWGVGGLAPATPEMDRIRRRRLPSGTTARLFTMPVAAMKSSRRDDSRFYHGCVASALRIDRIRRVLEFTRGGPMIPDFPTRTMPLLVFDFSDLQTCPVKLTCARVLDAPDLRDDFYCSILAYSPNCQKLAVGLGNILYIWSKGSGPRAIHGSAASHVWLTSVSFSSVQGGKCILAIGRSDGTLVLKSTYDALPRFQVQQPSPVSCVSWRPITTLRPSRNPFNPGITVQTEDLVIGDDTGVIYYYVVEWPMGWEVTRDTWPGTIYLIAKVSLHSQQICGLSWSANGRFFASGGNDNLCCLFDTDSVLVEKQESENAANVRPARPSSMAIRRLGPGSEKHRWIHKAAVKAIAFCPWREGLVATGGGSNNKCIHFFHTTSGSALATIAVSAQVTALIWSSTRREIAATFGYTEPEHPYRIAVFSWPECKQVAAIPWDGDIRALYAISYPRWPAKMKAMNHDQKLREGCIVVASSDKSVKFHEIWCNEGKVPGGGIGMLGGSGILESLEGIDKEGDVIR